MKSFGYPGEWSHPDDEQRTRNKNRLKRELPLPGWVPGKAKPFKNCVQPRPMPRFYLYVDCREILGVVKRALSPKTNEPRIRPDTPGIVFTQPEAETAQI